jgi:hypothetical protein
LVAFKQAAKEKEEAAAAAAAAAREAAAPPAQPLADAAPPKTPAAGPVKSYNSIQLEVDMEVEVSLNPKKHSLQFVVAKAKVADLNIDGTADIGVKVSNILNKFGGWDGF